MKKVVLPVIGMMALCAHSVTMEETRQLVRGYVEELDSCRDIIHFADIRKSLNAFDRDVKMSVYLEMIEENFDDPDIVKTIMGLFCGDDGWVQASYGNQEALEWARKVLREEDRNFDTRLASLYLLQKGDARDLDIIDTDFRDKLVMRMAGTNLVDYFPGPAHYYERAGWFECIPSVTNTGPQGLYVQVILHQCWEKMERDRSKIPAELLTMVVSFDADGNPVCNVDLAKYGLTMPELDVPVKPQAGGEGGADIPVCAQTRRQEFPNRGADSLRRLWLPAALVALTLLIGGIYARHKKLK